MPSVLLTRPQKDSEDLARDLSPLGYECIVEPLLKIEPTPTTPPDLTQLQAVMLTSIHALDFLDQKTPPIKILRALPCFCVGSRTASAAKAFGFETVYDAIGDGAALARYISHNLNAGNGALLHIAGRDTDSRGREALERQGFTVRVWATYKADAVATLSDSTIRRFHGAKLDSVLVFSARTATVLIELIERHGLETCCRRVIAIGISDTVQAALAGLPWHRLEGASAPSEDAVRQCLQKLCPVPEA